MRPSMRTRRPALELDPASDQWVTKGFVSSLDHATNWGGDAELYVLVCCYRIALFVTIAAYSNVRYSICGDCMSIQRNKL